MLLAEGSPVSCTIRAVNFMETSLTEQKFAIYQGTRKRKILSNKTFKLIRPPKGKRRWAKKTG
jgi:hypothetical protein